MPMLIRWIMLAALAVPCVPALAAHSKAGITAVFIRGKCREFNVGGVQTPCKMIVYTNYNNGRIDFSIPNATGLIGFSGNHDIQPDLRHYILVVDSVLNERASGTQNISANGRCMMNISPDGKIVHEVKCSVSSDIGSVTLDFIGNGQPVTIKHF